MRDDGSYGAGVYSGLWIFNQMAARSALECGGLTPPWHSISEENGGYATLASDQRGRRRQAAALQGASRMLL